MTNALDVMQCRFYELWIGTWPTSIDWTGAVVNTGVSAALETIAKASNATDGDHYSETIDKYFSHNIAYYFGEDAFSIRNEAYDDILWVVLGWLESIRFIEYRNYTKSSWHGTQFIPAFSHRARLFWDLASKGWDVDLCGGGMVWNPNLKPYKNAITNQLWISASIAMYLDFPGDEIDFPFVASGTKNLDSVLGSAHDPKYLQAAIDGYSWLRGSNMTNDYGLYVDGYHIRNWGQNGGIGTGKCDERNEMVYTYNQGVVLSGLRGLWEATGNTSYLYDGHKLIRNVIAATGWTWTGEQRSPSSKTTQWAGLGQNGVLEELCDPSGTCSQDAQTFKGIFFTHLTQFCQPLPLEARIPGKTYSASKDLKHKHDAVCGVVARWVAHNAQAALRTKDSSGLFGTWWGLQYAAQEDYPSLPADAMDYRNDPSLLYEQLWGLSGTRLHRQTRSIHNDDSGSTTASSQTAIQDINDRGRGRTVETQQGGLAVLRSAWELINMYLP